MNDGPSSYTPDIAARILRELADGRSLSEVCRDEGMPCRQSVQVWVERGHQGFAGTGAPRRSAMVIRPFILQPGHCGQAARRVDDRPHPR
jgi:Helix-turn-helix domain